MYIHIHVYVHVCIYRYICICIHTYTCIYTQVYTHTHTHVYMYMYIHLCGRKREPGKERSSTPTPPSLLKKYNLCVCATFKYIHDLWVTVRAARAFYLSLSLTRAQALARSLSLSLSLSLPRSLTPPSLKIIQSENEWRDTEVVKGLSTVGDTRICLDGARRVGNGWAPVVALEMAEQLSFARPLRSQKLYEPLHWRPFHIAPPHTHLTAAAAAPAAACAIARVGGSGGEPVFIANPDSRVENPV